MRSAAYQTTFRPKGQDKFKPSTQEMLLFYVFTLGIMELLKLIDWSTGSLFIVLNNLACRINKSTRRANKPDSCEPGLCKMIPYTNLSATAAARSQTN